jgi:mono/diheme cytochrome c family protein
MTEKKRGTRMKLYPWLSLLALAACVQEPIDGRQAFVADCAGCHGTDAKGDGPMAAQLTKPPANLTTLAARHGGTFPRDYVMSTIDGLARDPHFSTAMPEFGAGDMGQTIMVEQDGLGIPVPERLLALTDYLETLQQ